MKTPMQVLKRGGHAEPISFDKITNRLTALSTDLNVDPILVTQKTIQSLHDRISTEKIDEVSAEIAASLTIEHDPDYGILAGRILVSNHEKKQRNTFAETVVKLYETYDFHGEHTPVVSKELYDIVQEFGERLEAEIDYSRDYTYDFFAVKTLMRNYLLHRHEEVLERIQHMWMRVALGIHGRDIDRAVESYHAMSQKKFTHATPTLFHAGTPHSQYASCFLIANKSDSIDGIFNTLHDCATISKWGGGIGLHVHNVRAKGSRIRGTNGKSNGLVPMLKVFNHTARYVDQCFTPETFVYTRAGPKYIRDVAVGDGVLSADGTYQQVREVVRHVVHQELLRIGTPFCPEGVRVTPEHQVWVQRKDGVRRWIDAKDVQPGDYICLPLRKADQEHPIDLFSREDCRFLGMMVGGVTGTATPIWTLRGLSSEATDFAIDYLERRGLRPYLADATNAVSWMVGPGFKFVEKQLFDHGVRRVDPFVLNLSTEKLEALLRGVEDVVTPEIEGERLLQAQLRWLRWQTSQLPCGRCRIEGGVLLSPVDTVEKCMYEGVVHDFEMGGDHTYVTELGTAHNGGGKRKGSFAIYLEPWHADIFDFLNLKKNRGEEEMIARDLFYGLWIPDLFMKRVEMDGKWSLMCPDRCPGLSDCHSDAFEELYETYERAGRYERQVDARKLWNAILEAQIETGTPYLLYKDACNRKSNQKNLGTIKSSNLCTEIIQYSDAKETSVCNLASISLKAFVRVDDASAPVYDFEELRKTVHIMTRNLNRVIDRNFYPTPETRESNFRHRPIGLGVQGLADTFCLMGMPFESPEARELNRKIFATIYYAAVEQSIQEARERAVLVGKVKAGEMAAEDVVPAVTAVELARETHQGAYESYFENGGCPASRGQLQFDLWKVAPDPMWDWMALKAQIAEHGLRNSLLVAPMPTASTAQILGNTEAFEPFTSNLLIRRTLAGGFPVVNAYLMRDLMARGLWTPLIRTKLIATQGCLGPIPEIPEDLRNMYKTAWEIKQRAILDMAADRGAYIDQSQSMNLFVADPTISKLSSMHFYGWRLGLKTGCYYLRSQSASRAQAFTVDPRIMSELRLSITDSAGGSGAQTPVTSKQEEEECVMCSA